MQKASEGMPDVCVQAVSAFYLASSVDETACSVAISEPRRMIVKHWLFVCVLGRAFRHALENVGPQCWSSSDTETGLYLWTGHVRTARVLFQYTGKAREGAGEAVQYTENCGILVWNLPRWRKRCGAHMDFSERTDTTMN